MAFTEGDDAGVLNDTTNVTLVAAPPVGTRRLVRLVRIVNKDSAAVTVIVERYNGTTAFRLAKVTLAVDDALDVLTDSEVVVLSSAVKLIRARLASAAATVQPEWNTAWGDAS